MDYYKKYLKYKNKYVALKNDRNKYTCERKEECQFIKNTVPILRAQELNEQHKIQWDKVSSFANQTCVKLASLEKVQSNEPNINIEYNEKLKEIKDYNNDIVNNRNIKKPQSSCKI